MIGDTLCEAIQWVEGVRGVRGWHNPFVVRFMEGFVDAGMVEAAVDPVDAEICEADKEGELEVVVEAERSVRGCIVKFSVAADLNEEEGRSEDSHYGHGDHGLSDFECDLVFKVFRVGEGRVVEDEKIGKGGANEVDD